MAELEPEEKLTRARVQLQDNSPFFSYLVMSMEIKKSESTSTMGVDPRGKLYYNPDFVDDLTDEEVKGVLCHEVLHVALETELRRDKREKFLWNLATDLIINLKVSQNGFQLPDGVAYSTEYKDMCAEEVYNQIKDDLPDPPKVKTASKGGGGQGKGEKGGKGQQKSGKAEGSEKSPSKGSQSRKKDDENEGDGGKSEEREEFEDKAEKKYGKQFDEHKEAEDMSESEEKEVKEKWDRKIVEAHQHSQKRGKEPAGMETLIEDLLDRKLDWRSILRKYIKKEVPYDFTYASPHKKSKAVGFYMPNVKRESLEVVVAVDTSGSISDEMLSQFLSEVKGISKSHESVNMTLIEADAQIQETFELRNGNMNKLDNITMKGRGGTNHKCVYDWIEKNKPNARVVVALTDGFTSFPDNPKVRNTLWIVTESGAEDEHFPFGKVIRLPE